MTVNSHNVQNLLQKVFLSMFLMAVFSSCSVFRRQHVTHQHKHEVHKKEQRVIEPRIQQILHTANSYVGTPYAYGGQSIKGMDCSGLTFVCAKNAGQTIPRNSSAQSTIGYTISKDELQEGDLVFFATNPNHSGINHVGIVSYVQLPHTVKFIHASSSKGVIEDNFLSNYWKKTFVKAQRAFAF
jgi:probable lipoprotein NlpC